MKIWIDFENTPQVHFLLAIKEMLEENDKNQFVLSARDVFETVKLLKQKTDFPVLPIGNRHAKTINRKILLMFERFISVYKNIEKFDLSLSCGSESAIWTSTLRKKRSIAFGDNDTARQWTYSRFVDFCFFPKAIDQEILVKQGIKKHKLYQYDGFKEDIYIAKYKPNPAFLDALPFEKYVLVRPENIFANYIRKNNVKSIAPEILKGLVSKGFNILYLPKYEIDFSYIEKSDKVFIPDGPISGLDACYYADAVLTGAGTFAREAACMGTPAVSFYAGKDLLAVDRELIKQKRVFYSRNANDIIDYTGKSKKNNEDSKRSNAVYEEVKEKLIETIDKFQILE